jgi:hypothetical protein
MPVIRQQHAIDVYVEGTGGEEVVCITAYNAHYNEQSGKYENLCISIEPVHLDKFIDALDLCKKTLLFDKKHK